MVGASGYVVYRNDLGPLNSPPLPLTTTSFTHRANNDYRLTYAYTVVAQYPNGHTGLSNYRFLNLGLMPDLGFVGVINGPYSSGGRYRVPLRIERLPDAPVQAIRR